MKEKQHMKKKGSSTFNKIVAWIHLWPSIVSGIVVVFVCLTGTIIVYGDEIMDLSAGDAKYVTPGDTRLTYAEINERVLAKNSLYGISEAVFYKDPTRSVRLRIFDRKNVKMLLMYIDPYTGEILKEDTTIYFFFITAHLHAQLLAGPIGGWIVVVSTIIFFISSITGLILWWPKKWNKTTRKASFTVKWSAKFKRLNYDLHNVFGFYSLLLCVILSGTGLIIFFHTLMDVTVKVTGGDELGLMHYLPKADSTKTQLDMVTFAYKTLEEEYPEKEAASIRVYQSEKVGSFTFTTGKPGLKSIEKDDVTAYNKYTGEKITIKPETLTHEKTENTVWQLHMGQWWGQLGKLLTFLAGIVATSLPITGFIVWWGKQKKKKGNSLRHFIILTSLFIGLCSFAQTDAILVGFTIQHHSAVLNEERTLNIHLPDDYEKYPQQNYPIVVLLDSEMYFESYVGIQKNLSKDPHASIPKMIVVGIENTHRTRDLTPSKIEGIDHSGNEQPMFADGGGNEAFLKYINTELLPYIKANYRTEDYHILVGHSFGGLAVVNAFLEDAPFNAYLALDPSLWWDNQSMLKKADRIFANHTITKKTSLYMVLAHHNNSPDDVTNMTLPNMDFKKVLEKYNPENVRWKHEVFHQYDHGTVVIPSMYNGMLSIFEGYQTNARDMLKNPEYLEEHYKKFSEKIGYTFIPQLNYLNWISEFYKNDPNKQAVRTIITLKQKWYAKH
ncbi:hypothetical protein NBRC110019_21960 [Neptunitalea chrysea]|uniref:Uncharacterized protein n=1 Tax=Neptunitalea chrysea TaxID=1647581 RepID=A0A9W6B5Z6_9FLAO|nr:PepSY domain-containing protein [Neptunitalea chrysea]GLB53156.1 hypothetical protein NBRC110019_21960 [Neptunitalea chrysea]